ncbi:MAG TPA: cytochrome c oxidase subunit 4 [Longimicrobiales bacterium]
MTTAVAVEAAPAHAGHDDRPFVRKYIFSTDHKVIGIQFLFMSLLFLLLGGLLAMGIRWQLAFPADPAHPLPGGSVLPETMVNAGIILPEFYNSMVTMHGTIMIFFAIMPLLVGVFANYLIPLQIGARDVAFPRLNAFSFWTFLVGGIFLNTSWFLGGAPDGGWFNYAPNSGLPFSPGHGIDFYTIGLQITGIATLVGAINLITTCLNMRTKGMTLFRMPVLTWMLLVTQFLALFAMPVIAVALFLLTFDRLFDANFFNIDAGADPLLWQHLFWIFGHPEVYILVLPAFGITSEIIPTFARKPIFGYPFMVFSGIAIGFMGWGVWAHHMFASGLGPLSVAAFSLSTMFIAVPTGVKILNWLATMWGGRLRFDVPMLYAIAVPAMFTIGGLSGVTHAVSPADTQQTDTYYIIAHFHYVIFGGIIMAFYGGFYFWWPKIFGYRLSDRWGKINFWLQLIGMNLTFGPMHILGLQGMSRRIDHYSAGFGFEFWNLIVSIGAFVIAASVAAFVINVALSHYRFKKGLIPPASADPWDARSLEWMTASPVPEHNFDAEVEVHGLDEFWHRKYAYDDNHRLVQIATAEEVCHKGDAKGVHLPSPSYWPLITALGLPFIGYGFIFNLWLCLPGAVLTAAGLYGWAMEPADEPGAHGHDDEHAAGEELALATAGTEEGDHG